MNDIGDLPMRSFSFSTSKDPKTQRRCCFLVVSKDSLKKSGKQIANKKEEKNAKKVLFACFFLARFFPGVKNSPTSVYLTYLTDPRGILMLVFEPGSNICSFRGSDP